MQLCRDNGLFPATCTGNPHRPWSIHYFGRKQANQVDSWPGSFDIYWISRINLWLFGPITTEYSVQKRLNGLISFRVWGTENSSNLSKQLISLKLPYPFAAIEPKNETEYRRAFYHRDHEEILCPFINWYTYTPVFIGLELMFFDWPRGSLLQTRTRPQL